jgi:hypothetical protein
MALDCESLPLGQFRPLQDPARFIPSMLLRDPGRPAAIISSAAWTAASAPRGYRHLCGSQTRTLVLLWQEYGAEQVDGHGYSRFCDL